MMRGFRTARLEGIIEKREEGEDADTRGDVETPAPDAGGGKP
jgi:hypothetical protein